MTSPSEASLVFNIVWTGTVFEYLRYFADSLLAHGEARFRFVANGCPPGQVELMERYRAQHPDRVVEVLDVSPDAMVAHGVALDRVRDIRHDGEYFCLIDPDIKANGLWLKDLLDLLAGNAAVTSGKEVWSDDNLVPVDHVGVAGEHFFDRTGFVFGSPHLAVYRRAALDDTSQRWGVGLGSAGPELRDDTKAAMAAMGHEYLVYDTAKIVNALLQADGHGVVHHDLPQLVHIGGLAHYLSPSSYWTTDTGETEPEWTRYATMATRHEFTRYTARTLQALAAGDGAPEMPTGLDDPVEQRLRLVRREVVDLVQRYGRPTETRDH